MESSEYANIRNFEEIHWWYLSTHRAVMREITNLPRGSSVLDAGCGSGGLLDAMREQFSVTGLDASMAGLRIASARVDVSRQLTQGLIEALPFKAEQFDAVSCIDVIYHSAVHSEHVALSEIRRVLKPQGYLILQVPAFECLRGGHDEVVHTRKRYTMSEVAALLQDSGFNILKIRYRYPWLFLPALIVRRSSRNSKRSDLQPTPRIINSFLTYLSGFFDWQTFSFLPFGTSVFAVGKRA